MRRTRKLCRAQHSWSCTWPLRINTAGLPIATVTRAKRPRREGHHGLRSCPCTLRIITTGLPDRPSKGQKGLDERALTASQRPSPPCGRPRSRPCGRTAPAQATFPCCFPLLLLAHTPTGCGHGGTRKSNTSRRVHTRSVSPAAIAGVRGCHVLAEPVPLVGRGCGNGTRRLAWGKQKL